MRALLRVAKEGNFTSGHLREPEHGKYKQLKNLQIRLHFRCFCFCFAKCKVKKVQADRKTIAVEREKLTPCGFV